MEWMTPSALTPSDDLLHPVLHSLGHPGELQSVSCGGERQPLELLLQLRVAEQKAQRRTQIVHLRGGHTLHLGIPGGIEPGILAVQQKNLPRRIAIAPMHLSRFTQQQSAALFAVDAHSVKALGEGGAQRMETVVVLVHALRQLLRGIGAPRWSRKRDKRQQQDASAY